MHTGAEKTHPPAQIQGRRCFKRKGRKSAAFVS